MKDFPDATQAYADALADVDFVRHLWVEAGRPATQTAGNGMAGVHPLLKAVHDCETLANRLRGELGLTPRSAKSVVQRGPGRPAGAVSAVDRQPAVRLKAVP